MEAEEEDSSVHWIELYFSCTPICLSTGSPVNRTELTFRKPYNNSDSAAVPSQGERRLI